MTAPAITPNAPNILRRDISGLRLPGGGIGGLDIPTVRSLRPERLEPPETAHEFTSGWSLSAPLGASTFLGQLDGNNNVLFPSAALEVGNASHARIDSISIEGDAPSGTPKLIFSLRSDKQGQQFIGGFESIPLLGRGQLYSLSFDVFLTFLPGANIYGFVLNNDVAPRYAGMLIHGWIW